MSSIRTNFPRWKSKLGIFLNREPLGNACVFRLSRVTIFGVHALKSEFDEKSEKTHNSNSNESHKNVAKTNQAPSFLVYANVNLSDTIEDCGCHDDAFAESLGRDRLESNGGSDVATL